MANYYLGMDVSKGYCDFAILDANKETVRPGFQLDDTFEGHQKLLDFLANFIQAHPDAVIYAAVESTGGYENNWYERLKELASRLPLHVARLNPSMVKFNSQATLRRNKTDQISARYVAEYLISHPEKVPYDEEYYPMLRRQWKLIQMNNKQRNQLLNNLESILYISMPELLSFCRNGFPRWLLKVLKSCSTYQEFLYTGEDKLSQIPYVSKSRARHIIELVKKGVGNGDNISGQIISTLSSQILYLTQQINQQKSLLAKNYQEAKEEVELLISFTGIGVYSAVGMLLNIGSIDNFERVKNLTSYFGVHPVYKTSGDGKAGFHMSKTGRSEPRAILFMVAFSAIRTNPLIKELYSRCLAKGMNRMAAIGVCMHKILRIIYGMLKNKTKFNAEIDRRNRQRHQPDQKMPARNKYRRLQNFDKNAPVSRRQQRRRKEQTQSQSKRIAVNGIKEPAQEQNYQESVINENEFL